MKKTTQRLLSALCAAALLLGLVLLGVPALAAEGGHTLWIVGDSTVCDFGDADAFYYYPRYGYGTQVGNYLDGSYQVTNLAMSGRSSKSFLAEENYQTLLDGMAAGDALIIGFGHNDEKADAERYTNANGDWQSEGSLAQCLWANYVEPAQAKGVEVILCTPIVRRTEDTFTDSQLHITTDSGDFPGGDYPAAIRALGAAKNCAVVDLTALTRELYEALTPAETLYLHAWTSNSETSVDNTHLNIYGAKVVAYQLAKALQGGGTELGKHVDLSAGEPAKATDLVSNPDYVVKEYVRPVDGTGALGQPATVPNAAADPGEAPAQLTFYPTAFGDLGGTPTAGDEGNFHFTQEGDALRVSVALKGKIASSTEGLALYYLRLPVGTQFTFSATVTLNGVNTDSNPKQSAFGLMARDDMYLDVSDSSILGDYVAAGTFADGHSNCFYRRSGVLGLKDPLAAAPAEGQSYRVSITSNSDGFTCSIGDEEAQSGGFDFPLTANDSQYFYLCLFASRKMDVTFSDIALTTTGGAPALPEDGVPTARFADLPAGHWAQAAAEALADQGIMLGTDDTHFSPDTPTTRAMATTLVWRLAGSPMYALKPHQFEDVPDEPYTLWYVVPIRWAYEKGILNSYGDRDLTHSGHMGPNDPVTREQLAAILYRYHTQQGAADAAAGETLQAFPDAANVSSWAVDGMSWAVENGLIQGTDAGALNPQGFATRAEVAVILQRFQALEG